MGLSSCLFAELNHCSRSKEDTSILAISDTVVGVVYTQNTLLCKIKGGCNLTKHNRAQFLQLSIITTIHQTLQQTNVTNYSKPLKG